jgi:hypothetical protein
VAALRQRGGQQRNNYHKLPEQPKLIGDTGGEVRMGKNDWLAVGLKLLGVYFGVTGVASLWNVLVVLIAASSHGAHMESVGAIGVLQPLVYLLAAFFLVCRTRICVRWCDDSEPIRPA